MKTKILNVLSVLIFSAILLTSLVSATITFTNIPTLSQTGSSATITIASDQNETITFSGLNDITYSGETIIFNSIGSITINDTASQTITINYNVPSGFEFKLGEEHVTTLTAVGVSGTETQTLEFSEGSYCKYNNIDNDLDIDVDIKNNGKFGEKDEKWYPLDQIEVEIKVENTGNEDIENVEISWGLYNFETKDWVIEEDESDFDLDEGDDETITIEFQIDPDASDLDEDVEDYVFYVKATGEYAEGSNEGDKTCVGESDSIEVNFDRNMVGLGDIELTESVNCGTDVQLTADVWNIGKKDQDDVSVLVYIPSLGINQKITIGEIDSLDSEKLTFNIEVPNDAEEKLHDIELTVLDEDNDIYESDTDEESRYIALMRVDGGCTSGESVSVSAVLESGGKAGKELVVKATLTNTGDELTIYSINAAGFAQWAETAELSQSTVLIASGSSVEVLITFDVREDIKGDQSFDIELLSDGNLILKQPVAVTIDDSGFSFGGNWYLWLIGLLNLILVIVIIVVAVRILRK